jgi:AGCS family alanine or glycine:cation symporter
LTILNDILTQVNNVIWTYIIMIVLICCGFWFTWRMRFVQFRMLGEMIRLLTDASVPSVSDSQQSSTKKHISSFQAFAVSVASRVGTGNLAGVATAIAVGGPGAVFWMWTMALVGGATAFVESTLGQLFKQHAGDYYIGGPAYYISKGMRYCSWKPLRNSGRWMSVLFAVLITITFGLANNTTQANTICGAVSQAFGWSPVAIGTFIATLALLVVFGGIGRVARVSAVLVPLMAIGYFLLAVYIVVMNITAVPHILKVIVENAFGFSQVVGGGVGAAMVNGIKRGLFSNEAGEGSAPNAASTAEVTHPVKQGLIQALGVFTDTLLVCSCTAFIILLSGLYETPELNGINLTQSALQSKIGDAGPVFIAVAIFLFAFSSIIANYYYGEANIRFMTKSRSVMTVYRILSGGVMVMLGALVSLDMAWNMVDLCMALLTACNLVAIIALGKYAFRLLDDYRSQKRQGIRDPKFHRQKMPDIAGSLDCWE